MDKTEESFGQMLRYRRKLRGFTQDSLADEMGVADKTVGKWERDEVLPSPSNMLALERLGLIDPWGTRNGDWENRLSLPRELSDRVRRTFGCPASELLGQVVDVRDESESMMIAYFRRLSNRQRWSVLDIVSSMTVAVKPQNDQPDRGR